MKISKESWHFKVACMIAGGCYGVHDNLCGYFRQVMIGVFVLIFGAIPVAGVALILIAPFFMNDTRDIAIASMILWGGVGFLALLIARDFYDDHRHDDHKPLLLRDIAPKAKLNITVPENSFMKVIGAYIRAAKEKVCPMIEFE